MARLIQEKVKQPLAEELLFGKLVERRRGACLRSRKPRAASQCAFAFELTPAPPKLVKKKGQAWRAAPVRARCRGRSRDRQARSEARLRRRLRPGALSECSHVDQDAGAYREPRCRIASGGNASPRTVPHPQREAGRLPALSGLYQAPASFDHCQASNRSGLSQSRSVSARDLSNLRTTGHRLVYFGREAASSLGNMSCHSALVELAVSVLVGRLERMPLHCAIHSASVSFGRRRPDRHREMICAELGTHCDRPMRGTRAASSSGAVPIASVTDRYRWRRTRCPRRRRSPRRRQSRHRRCRALERAQSAAAPAGSCGRRRDRGCDRSARRAIESRSASPRRTLARCMPASRDRARISGRSDQRGRNCCLHRRHPDPLLDHPTALRPHPQCRTERELGCNRPRRWNFAPPTPIYHRCATLSAG